MMRLLGALLLILTGWGCGMAAAQRQQDTWTQLHTFVRLLNRLRTEICYRAQPAADLLAETAADPAFAAFRLADCRELGDLPVPAAFGQALACEVRAGLSALAFVPREEVCRSLEHLAALCADAAEEQRKTVKTVKILYPRLGGCLGAVAALLFF